LPPIGQYRYADARPLVQAPCGIQPFCRAKHTAQHWPSNRPGYTRAPRHPSRSLQQHATDDVGGRRAKRATVHAREDGHVGAGQAQPLKASV
jgi:hypothetical protein